MTRLLFSILLLLILTYGLYSFLGEKNGPNKKVILQIPTITTNFPSKKSIDYEPKLPTVGQIFSTKHTSWTASLSAQRKRVIHSTGDVIPARSVNYQATIRNDYKWPFEKLADFVRDADLTFINLETPLLKNCPPTQEGMIFCGSDKHIQGLKLAGVNLVSLANNHAGNHGVEGVQDTRKLLEENGISVTGINGPKIIQVRGLRFAFLGYNDISAPQPGISNYDDQKMKQEIKDAKQNADVVIVTFHWGVEYRAQPDDRQIMLAHQAIDEGADLIIGNHPHWIQPIEIYRGKLITYAHGNFVFDQMWSEKTKLGVLGKYTFYDNQLIDVEYFPVYIKDFGQPELLEGQSKQQVLDDMRRESFIRMQTLLNNQFK